MEIDVRRDEVWQYERIVRLREEVRSGKKNEFEMRRYMGSVLCHCRETMDRNGFLLYKPRIGLEFLISSATDLNVETSNEIVDWLQIHASGSVGSWCKSGHLFDRCVGEIGAAQGPSSAFGNLAHCCLLLYIPQIGHSIASTSSNIFFIRRECGGLVE